VAGVALFLVGLMIVGPGAVAATAPEPLPDPRLTCPTIEGMAPPSDSTAYYSEREGLVLVFGSTARISTLSLAECSYSSDPADEAAPVGWATVEVYWATPSTIEEHRARACTLAETERDGVGVVTLGGSTAAYATYSVNAAEPVDTAPFAAAARALLDQVAPLASSCDGVAAPPAPATEVSGLLAGAFSPDVLAGGGGPTSPTEATPDAADGSTDPADPTPAGPGGADQSAAAGASEEGAPAWLRALGVVALIASLALLALTFVMIRRETRIRPVFDIARVLVIVVVAVAGTALLADGTSAVAVVIAIVLGFAVGAWQGSKLVVRSVGEGWTSRRAGWSVIAFAIGIAVTQIAARLDSVAGLTLGLSTTFLSAALAAGVIVGRRGRLVDARRAATVTAVVLFALALAAVPTRESSRADDGDPETVLADERTDTQTALVELVDWSSIDIRGGLFADEGKPGVEASVPAALDAAPDPVTNSTSWSVDLGAGPVTYTVDETYTFGLRNDGICCTVDYVGSGTTTDPGGTVTTYEAAGRLADVQSVAIEGSPDNVQAFAVLGVPFGEAQSFAGSNAPGDLPATSDPATCGRPVAQQRSSFDLEQTGGEAALTTYRVDGLDREPPGGFDRLTMTTDCEVPGFTPADALALAPPAPPIDDPTRGAGCPVFQEVLGALVPASNLAGVDTTTTARAFLAPNAPSCSDSLTLGQGGPGETRHELRYQFAQPTDPAFGEDSSQVDEIYWTDLPLASDIPADLRCVVDESGAPVAPADPSIGCQQVDRYDIDGMRVFVMTDWQTSDGPNVVVFVTAPWGSYSYRCHHCTPTDPAIADFLAAFNTLAVDTGEQIANVAETMPTSDDPEAVDDVIEPTGTSVDSDPDDADEGDAGEGDAAAATTPSSSTDRSEPAAVAALLGLGGAAAMLGLTLGELSGWRASDAEGAGLGRESAAGDALGFLNSVQAFDQALADYQRAGYDPQLAAVLAATEVLGGNAAGDANPFGGIADNRVDQVSEALLPEGVRSALVPSEVVKNNLRTGLLALNAYAESLGASWDSNKWDTTALDRFIAQIEARPGADPFSGYSQLTGLYFDELYNNEGGVPLLQDLTNLVIGGPDGGPLFDDPGRVTREDFAEALYEGAATFRDEVAAGQHHVVLQGIDDVFGITAELVTDPAEALGGFVDDLVNIAENGVGDGYWTDVAAHVDAVVRDVPVVKVIYSGYHEVFSGIVSHADSADDLLTGAAQAGFAAELAEGAAALGSEAIDLVVGGDNAVRAFDYVRSLF
jgi:hypothetical protein